jgi:hypothetical protein
MQIQWLSQKTNNEYSDEPYFIETLEKYLKSLR